jgi:type VI secretion system protein ImpJ
VKNLTPVVWHEGMHLAQHHFQAQTRYFESLTSFVTSELFFRPYGVLACEFDSEALQNDTLALRHARGILPDGLGFHFPEEPAPEARNIRELFSPTQTSHIVLLGIAPHHEGRANCVLAEGAGNGDARRFRAAAADVLDEVSGADPRPVSFARKEFRLLLDVEDVSGFVTLPLGRVKRDGTGHFALDPDFVPPTLRIGGSERLMRMLGRLVEGLTARSESLASERAEPAGDLVGYWLANTINVSLGPLAHLYRTRAAHPEQLYVEMLRLAGALCTFSMQAHPRDLPQYDHDEPSDCFAALERRIVDLMNVVAPSGSVRIPLRAREDSYYQGMVTDPRCLGSGAEWFLGVRASESPAELAARVPRLVKLCSGKFIERLVREAFPGLPLQPLVSPPPGISPRAGTQYFSVPKTGPCWASIVETREVGVYAPASLADLELELAVLVGDTG